MFFLKDLDAKLSNKKCIVFDFDETLVDLDSTKMFWKEVMDGLTEIALEKYEKNINFHEFYKGFKIAEKELGQEALNVFENYVKSQEKDAILNIATINTRGKEIFNYIQEKLVSKSNDKVWIAILSNNFVQTLKLGLKRFDLLKNIDLIYGRDSVKKMKPNPEGLNKIFEKIGNITKSDMVLFGDSIYDKNAAKNFKIEFICVKDMCSD